MMGFRYFLDRYTVLLCHARNRTYLIVVRTTLVIVFGAAAVVGGGDDVGGVWLAVYSAMLSAVSIDDTHPETNDMICCLFGPHTSAQFLNTLGVSIVVSGMGVGSDHIAISVISRNTQMW